MARVKINVSGTYFEFDKNLIEDGKSSKLIELCSESQDVDGLLEITVDCSALGFGSILSYLQMGELHMPPGVCPGAFCRELDFWEVDYDCLHECCMFRYQSFLDEENTRKQFLHKARPTTATVAPVSKGQVPGCMKGFRTKLWNVIDNHENSKLAKVYFILISALVVVSILVLAYSTHPDNRRLVTKCELLDYMENTHPELVKKIRDILGNPECSGNTWLLSEWNDKEMFDLFSYDWNYDDPDMVSGKGDKPNKSTNSSRAAKNVSSTTTASNEDDGEKLLIHIPKLDLAKPIFNILDTAVSAVFTVDFFLRIYSCPSIRLYFLSIINVVDALALLATYIYVIIVTVDRKYLYEQSQNSFMVLLDFAQVFRALRLFRVVKNVRASRVLAYSLTRDISDMSLLVTLLFVGVTTFAYLFYFAESMDTVKSVPDAWYWAIVTMTTVGYGDISPKTGFGRAISSLCAISGVLLLSITLPMFVNNFLTLYQYSCANDSIKKRKELKENKIKVKILNCKETAEDFVNNSNFVEQNQPPSYRTTQKPVVDEYVNDKQQACQITDI